MPKKQRVWNPTYTINTNIARALMDIEAAKAVVENTYLPPSVEAELRHRARVRSTHYSTRIEGNRLSLKQAEEIIEQKKTHFHGRERDVREVIHYWDALLKVEEWAVKGMELSEDLIKRLHAIVEHGKRAEVSAYRDGQNVIHDSATGAIVYLPPEAKDVPHLMREMVMWIKRTQREKIPAPVMASLLHYQFVTIHPYYDGNGRTARLLATFILQRDGYGLNGFFSMEEHHARDLAAYYKSLAVHEHHNYYMGREKADLTAWVEYFVLLLARVFTLAKDESLALAEKGAKVEPEELRKLDHRGRMILGLFAKKDRITTQDIARMLGLSPRTVRDLIKKWLDEGWLIIADKSNRSRSYSLSAVYRRFIGEIKVV